MPASKDILNSLLSAATKAQKNSYSPYSNYPVGSAVLSSNGNIYAGCNVETANYDGTCAEAGSIASMVANGDQLISDIVVIGPNDHLCTPCGRCRQRIREFSDQNTKVHIYAPNGTKLKEYTVTELLPDSFGPENLKR